MKLHHVHRADDTDSYSFHCPACGFDHTYLIKKDDGEELWFNGDLENPTFSGSLLTLGVRTKCRLRVMSGVIRYGEDCNHRFAGLSMVMLPWENGALGEQSEC